ncbi:hypothetical protein ABPG74_002013 [Tetrahymena malaccensis]
MNEELNYLAQTIKNSDSADKNSGINYLMNNRKIAKSFSIISPKPQTHSDLQVNIQINGEASIKSQYPNSNIDLDLDKKKVNTEIQFADQDDNLINTTRLLDLQINNMDKSKHANGNCSVQTAYFKDKNSMSINHNQPSSFFPNNNRLEVGQNNQISRFGLSQNNINLVKSEIEDYEDCDDVIDEVGEFTKAEVTKYQFRTKEPQLGMKKEQIFSRQNNKAIQSVSFCNNNNNNINQTFATNRNGSCEQLPNSSRRRFLSNHQGALGGQNMFLQNQSKEFSYDLTSSRAKQNNKEQNNSQLVPYSFMQSHGIQDSSHNSTSDQQDYLIILSNASIESDSNSPQQTQRDQKKQQPQTFVPILEENVLETNRSTLNSFNKIERKVNETQLINSFHLKNKNGNTIKTSLEINAKPNFKQIQCYKNTSTMTEELDETFEKEKITKHQFEVLSPNLSRKREQIFNPSSKKGSTNSSFSTNNNVSNYINLNLVDHTPNQIQLFSPKNSNPNLKTVSSSFNPTQNILQYTYTKGQIDKLIAQQSNSKYKGPQFEYQQQQQQVLPFSIKQSHENTNNPSAPTNFISKNPQIVLNQTQKQQQQQQQIQQPSLKNQQIQNKQKNNKIE